MGDFVKYEMCKYFAVILNFVRLLNHKAFVTFITRAKISHNHQKETSFCKFFKQMTG